MAKKSLRDIDDRVAKALEIARRQGQDVRISEYEITFDPISNKHNKIPHQIRNQLEDLADLVREDPQQAIPDLLALKEAYPNTPVIYNLLSSAYNRMGDNKTSREVAAENYRNNPDYLFAKINHAQFCLYEGDFDKIPEIFDGKYDLKLLYPRRKRFHVSEFAGFTAVMCAYLSVTGRKETAKLFYDSLLAVAPDSELVFFAKRFFKPSLLGRLRIWAQKKGRIKEDFDGMDDQPPSDNESRFSA
jgi:tetratricopeptide (TPR) repeat protein